MKDNLGFSGEENAFSVQWPLKTIKILNSMLTVESKNFDQLQKLPTMKLKLKFYSCPKRNYYETH